MDRSCFSVLIMFQWIVYAVCQAYLIYAICFHALNYFTVNQNDGKAIGLWVGGLTVYGVCIFVANLKLGCNAQTYHWFGVFLLLLGPISYFVFYALLSTVFVGDIGSLFMPNFSINIVWIAIIFCLILVYTMEKSW